MKRFDGLKKHTRTHTNRRIDSRRLISSVYWIEKWSVKICLSIFFFLFILCINRFFFLNPHQFVHESIKDSRAAGVLINKWILIVFFIRCLSLTNEFCFPAKVSTKFIRWIYFNMIISIPCLESSEKTWWNSTQEIRNEITNNICFLNQ